MKIKSTFRWFVFLGILYIFVATFVYYRMIITDGQEYISMVGGMIVGFLLFVYILKKVQKGVEEILEEEETYWAVGYLFIKVAKALLFPIIYSILQFFFHTDYSMMYGLSILIPSAILFLWSCGEIKEINNRRWRKWKKAIGISITFFWKSDFLEYFYIIKDWTRTRSTSVCKYHFVIFSFI